MSEPILSAILVTPDDWTNMRNTLQALRMQTICAQMELVLVGPSLDALAAPTSEIAPFAKIQRVAIPRTTTIGHSYAEGVRAATSPLVVFTEDHCYPEPEWAELFVRRHASGNWAGVGPTVINANPAYAASWAQFLTEYGQYSEAGPKGPSRQIPGHNSCYQRHELLAYGADLADWLECETLMHWDMADRGLGLYVDPTIRTHHWNCTRMHSTLGFSWYFLRQFAAYRSRRMTPLKQATMAVLWPLIPLIRLKRIWPIATSLLGYRRAIITFPAVAVNLFVSGAAEGLGYLTGTSAALHHMLDREFHRERYLRPGEQLTLPKACTTAKVPKQRQAYAVHAPA
jgi:hypothetical protein